MMPHMCGGPPGSGTPILDAARQFRWCAPLSCPQPAGEGSPDDPLHRVDQPVGHGRRPARRSAPPPSPARAARCRSAARAPGPARPARSRPWRRPAASRSTTPASLPGTAHVAQHLRAAGSSPTASSASGRPVRAITSSSWMPVSTPSPVVARSEKITWPDCSPPSEKPPASRASSTERSPTSVSTTLMPLLGHRLAEAEVGHHGDHHGVVGSRPRSWRSTAQIAMRWSPSTTLPSASTRDEPVGVAVEREADVGAAGWRRPAGATRGGSSRSRR